jgi:hypothetical protein
MEMLLVGWHFRVVEVIGTNSGLELEEKVEVVMEWLLEVKLKDLMLEVVMMVMVVVVMVMKLLEVRLEEDLMLEVMVMGWLLGGKLEDLMLEVVVMVAVVKDLRLEVKPEGLTPVGMVLWLEVKPEGKLEGLMPAVSGLLWGLKLEEMTPAETVL